jgi:hypothetical protein
VSLKNVLIVPLRAPISTSEIDKAIMANNLPSPERQVAVSFSKGS